MKTKDIENIIHVPPKMPNNILKEILESIPNFSFLELYYEETNTSIRGFKNDKNEIMILQFKDHNEKGYNRNKGFRKSTIKVSLDISKL